MIKYSVQGMSCAACAAAVEKAAAKTDGITSASVNLLSNTLTVDGSFDERALKLEIKKAGYVLVTEKDGGGTALLVREAKKVRVRLTFSCALLLPLIFVSMGQMAGLPFYPAFLAENAAFKGLAELIFCLPALILNRKYFINGVRTVINGAPGMDTLVALGSGVSFLFSVYSLIRAFLSASYVPEYYFEPSAMIVTFVTVGKLLEGRAKAATGSAAEGLKKLAPDEVSVIRGGKEQLIKNGELVAGDVFIVRPGEYIPADGVVTKGFTSVNEGALTGESMPVDKTCGDSVRTGTVNLGGVIECLAERVGSQTVLSGIIDAVAAASASKPRIARIADKAAAVFAPAVFAVSLVTFTVWMIVKGDAGFAFSRAAAVLVISCPCAMGLATPVAVTVGSGVAAKNGILFKSASVMEKLAGIKCVFLDKTGTVTKGECSVSDVIPVEKGAENALLLSALSAEKNSTHPLAAAIVKYASGKGLRGADTRDFENVPGEGVICKTDAGDVIAGKLSFAMKYAAVPAFILAENERLTNEGKTVVFTVLGNKLLGIIALSDEIRPEAGQVVTELKKYGAEVILLTGDNENAAKAVAEKIGADSFRAGVTPTGKLEIIREKQRSCRVLMAGDGINDAPALSAADVSVAMGGGTDIAIDSADIVLLSSSPAGIPLALRTGRATVANIKENLFWAFFYNALCIPAAAGVFYAFGLRAPGPAVSALAMSLSSFCVCMNALRLKRIGKNTAMTAPGPEADEQGGKEMYSLIVKGMMCEHCERHAKTALEALPFVVSAEADHNKERVYLVCSAEPDFDLIGQALAAEGFTSEGLE